MRGLGKLRFAFVAVTGLALTCAFAVSNSPAGQRSYICPNGVSVDTPARCLALSGHPCPTGTNANGAECQTPAQLGSEQQQLMQKMTNGIAKKSDDQAIGVLNPADK